MTDVFPIFYYDVHHQITTVQGQGPSTRYHYDPAGNPVESAGEYLWDNLLKRLGGARWEYDGFGRLLWRKANYHAAIQHFSYDDEQRVSAITFEGHSEFERIEFCYDIFGRRREKRVYRHAQNTPEIIEFFWTGAKMTGECSSARPGEMTQYHYSEDSWEPIARTDSTEYGENTYWYHCGLNGLPTEMSNASGKVVWRGEENQWGEISHEISHFSANAVQQNLRI
ncbi:RHS domain-containing protein [Rosenbergiella epipactidis]|uniref:RHS domain-containing protein n=1 Tax=Rosenbergiella epipactidis TaxID=1544694 RepID=UPI001F4EC9BD|nr:RHS domain-containing protein [Rosenbergiella epipactidis]